MKLTINDIAKLAGVSKTTVSRVINNKPDVNPEVRNRIKNIIFENGYHPNAAAVAIAKQRSYTIAMIIPYEFNYILANPYYTELIYTIIHCLEERGYYLLFAFPSKEKYMEIAKQSRVDGFIILTSNLMQTDIFKYLISIFLYQPTPALLVFQASILGVALSLVSAVLARIFYRESDWKYVQPFLSPNMAPPIETPVSSALSSPMEIMTDGTQHRSSVHDEPTQTQP